MHAVSQALDARGGRLELRPTSPARGRVEAGAREQRPVEEEHARVEQPRQPVDGVPHHAQRPAEQRVAQVGDTGAPVRERARVQVAPAGPATRTRTGRADAPRRAPPRSSRAPLAAAASPRARARPGSRPRTGARAGRSRSTGQDCQNTISRARGGLRAQPAASTTASERDGQRERAPASHAPLRSPWAISMARRTKPFVGAQQPLGLRRGRSPRLSMTIAVFTLLARGLDRASRLVVAHARRRSSPCAGCARPASGCWPSGPPSCSRRPCPSARTPRSRSC